MPVGLYQCLITGNNNTGLYSAGGGGIYGISASLFLNECNITYNTVSNINSSKGGGNSCLYMCERACVRM